jgi:hypothetical protein
MGNRYKIYVTCHEQKKKEKNLLTMGNIKSYKILKPITTTLDVYAL